MTPFPSVFWKLIPPVPYSNPMFLDMIDLQINWSCQRDDNDQMVALVAVFTDVTETPAVSIAPKPAQGFGKYGTTMRQIMPAGAKLKLEVIVCPGQCTGHCLVGECPITERCVGVVFTTLQKSPDRLTVSFSNY